MPTQPTQRIHLAELVLTSSPPIKLRSKLIRNIDTLLGWLTGRGNTILHWFARCLTVMAISCSVVIGSALSIQSTTEWVASRQKARAADAAAAATQKEVDSSAIAEEKAKQPTRWGMIEVFTAAGVIEKVEMRAAGATIWVGPVFYGLSAERQEDCYQLVWSYLVVETGSTMNSVLVREVGTNKYLGTYNQTSGLCKYDWVLLPDGW